MSQLYDVTLTAIGQARKLKLDKEAAKSLFDGMINCTFDRSMMDDNPDDYFEREWSKLLTENQSEGKGGEMTDLKAWYDYDPTLAKYPNLVSEQEELAGLAEDYSATVEPMNPDAEIDTYSRWELIQAYKAGFRCAEMKCRAS